MSWKLTRGHGWKIFFMGFVSIFIIIFGLFIPRPLATMKTIQNKIIKTAAWVKEMKTRIKIELLQFCPTKNEQIKGFVMLMTLRM